MLASKNCSPDWIQVYSSKKNAYYWFNTKDGRSQWTQPTDSVIVPESGMSKLPRDRPSSGDHDNDDNGKLAKRQKINHDDRHDASIVRKCPTIGIVVPFRDIHAEQKRAAHLSTFVPAMTRYDIQFHIVNTVNLINYIDFYQHQVKYSEYI